MMKVSDLDRLVPDTMKCHVYYHTRVNTEGCVAGKKIEYMSNDDIFNDYTYGITFRELRQYKFVWNADICFMEPGNKQMFIIIYKQREY